MKTSYTRNRMQLRLEWSQQHEELTSCFFEIGSSKERLASWAQPAPGYLATSHKRLLLYNSIIKGKKECSSLSEKIFRRRICASYSNCCCECCEKEESEEEANWFPYMSSEIQKSQLTFHELPCNRIYKSSWSIYAEILPFLLVFFIEHVSRSPDPQQHLCEAGGFEWQ